MKQYTSEDWLREKYWGDNLNQREIAEICDVCQTTIGNWMEEHDIETRLVTDTPWRDPELLEELYRGQRMSTYEVADELECGQTTVRRWLKRHGIDTRETREGQLLWEAKNPAGFALDEKGYERWSNEHEGRRYSVRVHRLLAVAEYGLDAVEGMHVHHKNGCGFDNRPSNIELMEPGEHARHHHGLDDPEGAAEPEATVDVEDLQ